MLLLLAAGLHGVHELAEFVIARSFDKLLLENGKPINWRCGPAGVAGAISQERPLGGMGKPPLGAPRNARFQQAALQRRLLNLRSRGPAKNPDGFVFLR